LIIYHFSSIIKNRRTKAIVLRKASPLYSAHVDRRSSLLCPAFYTLANYSLSHTFLPQFISCFLPISTPALPLFTKTHLCLIL